VLDISTGLADPRLGVSQVCVVIPSDSNGYSEPRTQLQHLSCHT